MYDSNQLGMYMPVIETFHRNMMKIDRDADGLRAMCDDMEFFWKELCIPEALACNTKTTG